MNFSAQYSVFFPFSFVFHISVARGPHLRSAPLALPSVRDATWCGIFHLFFHQSATIATSSDLRSAASAPALAGCFTGYKTPQLRRRLRQLRYYVANIPHSASHSLHSYCFVMVCLFIVGWPSCVRTPSLQQNSGARILHSAAASHTHKSCGTLRDPLSGRLRRPAAGIREFVRTRAAAAQNTRQGQLAALPGLYACVSTVGYLGWMTSRIEALSFIFTAPVRRCRGVSRVQTSSSVPLFPVSFSLPLSFSMLYTSQVQKIRPII